MPESDPPDEGETTEQPVQPKNESRTDSNSAAHSEPGALLSPAGLAELRRYVTSPEDITRQILAQYLKFEPRSPAFRHWMASVSIRELVGDSAEPLLDRLRRTLSKQHDNWELIEADARDAFRLANEVSEMIHQESRHRYFLG